nr:DNA helicase [Tanacetum cinerariifolium]
SDLVLFLLMIIDYISVDYISFELITLDLGLGTFASVSSSVCRTQDAKLYLDVYQKYRHGCKEVLREGPSMISNGIPSVDYESRKLKSIEAIDVFQAYSDIRLRGIGGRRSVNVRQTTTVSSCNFIHDNGLRNTSPSTSRAGTNARENPDVGLTTGEDTCSRGIGGRCSNFIRDIDVRNTGPSTLRADRNARGNPDVSLTTDVRNIVPSTSRAGRNARGNSNVCLNVRNTSRGGRNTRANLDVGLTIAQASSTSGVTRRHSVRRHPSTRGPTVGSTSASGIGTSYTYTDFGDSDQRCCHYGASFDYSKQLGISLQSFGLPSPPPDLLEQLANRLLMEERNYNQEELTQLKNDFVLRLNIGQKEIYDLIMNTDENSRQELIFFYSHGRTGKTFLWKTIISSLRSQGKIVLAAASLADTDLIIWDEAPMNDHRCFEALDRSLRDINNKQFSLFGGKSVLLGGDFQQTLPVKKGA